MEPVAPPPAASPRTEVSDLIDGWPDFSANSAHEALCEWFDQQLAILEIRFVDFQTVGSAKTR